MAGQDIQKISVQITGNSGPLIKELEKAGNTANRVISQIKRESDAVARKGANAGLADQVTLKQNLELLKLYGSDKLLQGRIQSQMRMIELQKQFNALQKMGASERTLGTAASAMGDVKASKLAGGVASPEALSTAEGIMGRLVSEEQEFIDLVREEAAAREQARMGVESAIKLDQQRQKALQDYADMFDGLENDRIAKEKAGWESWWKLQEQKRKAIADTAAQEEKAEEDRVAKVNAGWNAWMKLQEQKQRTLADNAAEEEARIEKMVQYQFSASRKQERTDAHNFEKNRRQLQALSGLIEEVGGDTTEAAIAMDRYAELVDEAARTSGWSKMKTDIDAARDAVSKLIAEQSKLTGVDVGGEVGVQSIVGGAGGAGGQKKTGKRYQAAITQGIFALDDFTTSLGTGGLSGAVRGASNNVTQMAQLLAPSSGWILGMTVAGTAVAQLALTMIDWDKILSTSTDSILGLADAEERLAEARKKQTKAIEDFLGMAGAGGRSEASERSRRATELAGGIVSAQREEAGALLAAADPMATGLMGRRQRTEEALGEASSPAARRALRERLAGLDQAIANRIEELTNDPSLLAAGVQGTGNLVNRIRSMGSGPEGSAAVRAMIEEYDALLEMGGSPDTATRQLFQRFVDELGESAVLGAISLANDVTANLAAGDASTAAERASVLSGSAGRLTAMSGLREDALTALGGMSNQSAAADLSSQLVVLADRAGFLAQAFADNEIQEEEYRRGLDQLRRDHEDLSAEIKERIAAEKAAAASFEERERQFDAYLGNSDIGDQMQQTLEIRDWMSGARRFGRTEAQAREEARRRFGGELEALGESGILSKAALGVESLRTSNELVRLLSGDDSSRKLFDINKKQLEEQKETNRLIDQQASAAYAVAD